MTQDVFIQPYGVLTFAAGTASAAAAQSLGQPALGSSTPMNLQKLRILNDAQGVAFVQWGATGVVATTTTGYPIAPRVPEVVNMGNGWPAVSVIMGTGTGNVYVSPCM